MADSHSSDYWNNNEWFDFESFPTTALLPCDATSLNHAANLTPPDDTRRDNTPSSSDTFSSDTLLEGVRTPYSNSRRRRQTSERFSDTLVHTRKTRKVKAPHKTAKIREKGACFLCRTMKKECEDGDDPEGPCRRCLERSDRITLIPGLIRPLCWRPNLGFTEVFRRGPTIDFAASLRGNSKAAGPGKQALWKRFATRRSGREPSKIVELSQNWTEKTLSIQLDRYKPMDTDKQYYSWFDTSVEQHYQTPPYGIANLKVASSAIQKFLGQNFKGYIEANLRDATEITRKTFQVAQDHKHLPLVERALKLWVGCRFIEEPWSIAGSERLGMCRDENPNCPYHDRIPVPPIVDLQIDLIVINELLQPKLKKILQKLKTMLEASDPWNDWFQIYLACFILLHNVELTMAHDAWFVKRNNLKRKYSNKPLVDTVMQGATTLLTCFHYAHQGYAPFSNPELEHTQQWPEKQKAYLQDIRPMLQCIRGNHVHDPAKELFWTSQLHKPDWRPIVLVD